MSGLELFYWPIKARGSPAFFVAKYGGLNIEWKQVNWPEEKSQTVFGQLPMLKDLDSGITVCQSNAMARYVARKANLDGHDNDADFALTAMLMDQAEDIFTLLAKAHYNAEGRKAAYDAVFAAEGPLHTKLAPLEAMLGDKPQFCSRVLAGGICIVLQLNIVESLQPGHLDAYPNLKRFYTSLIDQEAFAHLKTLSNYLQRE